LILFNRTIRRLRWSQTRRAIIFSINRVLLWSKNSQEAPLEPNKMGYKFFYKQGAPSGAKIVRRLITKRRTFQQAYLGLPLVFLVVIE
jgi:hypothetical protein